MSRPVPQPTHLTQPFWDGLEERKVRIQYSPSQDQWVFYPRVLAPGSLADDLEWREVSGAATLYSFTIARMAVSEAFKSAEPRIPAVVELKEGPRLATELVGIDPSTVRIGMELEPEFVKLEQTDMTLLYYRDVRVEQVS